MSTNSIVLVKSCSEALGMPQAQIDEIWRMLPGNQFRRVLLYEIERQIYERSQKSPPSTIDEIHFEKGFREACFVISGILNRKP